MPAPVDPRCEADRDSRRVFIENGGSDAICHGPPNSGAAKRVVQQKSMAHRAMPLDSGAARCRSAAPSGQVLRTADTTDFFLQLKLLLLQA